MNTDSAEYKQGSQPSDLCPDACSDRRSMHARCGISSKPSAHVKVKDTRVDTVVLSIAVIHFIMLLRVAESCDSSATAPISCMMQPKLDIHHTFCPTPSTKSYFLGSLSATKYLHGGIFWMQRHSDFDCSRATVDLWAHEDIRAPLHKGCVPALLRLRQRRPPKLSRFTEINE